MKGIHSSTWFIGFSGLINLPPAVVYRSTINGVLAYICIGSFFFFAKREWI